MDCTASKPASLALAADTASIKKEILDIGVTGPVKGKNMGQDKAINDVPVAMDELNLSKKTIQTAANEELMVEDAHHIIKEAGSRSLVLEAINNTKMMTGLSPEMQELIPMLHTLARVVSNETKEIMDKTSKPEVSDTEPSAKDEEDMAALDKTVVVLTMETIENRKRIITEKARLGIDDMTDKKNFEIEYQQKLAHKQALETLLSCQKQAFVHFATMAAKISEDEAEEKNQVCSFLKEMSKGLDEDLDVTSEPDENFNAEEVPTMVDIGRALRIKYQTNEQKNEMASILRSYVLMLETDEVDISWVLSKLNDFLFSI